MADYRIWPATNGPNTTFVEPGGINTGTEFFTSTSAWVTKIWYWRGSVTQGSQAVQGQIYRIDGVQTATALLGVPATFPTPSGTGWQSVDITPLAINAVQRYKVVTFYPDGEYTATVGNNYWANGGPGSSGITNGILTAPQGSLSNDGQATFRPGGAIAYPFSVFQSGNYWVDVTVTDTLSNPTKNAAFMAFFGS